ncbi:MAG: ferredoxin family protein [Bacillota bacterium]|nr:MAG: ferredoxin [Bacillota bacterium]
MAWVITEPCVGHKYAKCVEHCPVNAIQTAEGEPQYYIDPDLCINCGSCDLACPVAAIFPEEAVPEQWLAYIALNREFFARKKGAQRRETA